MNKLGRIQAILADTHKWQEDVARLGKESAILYPSVTQFGNDLIKATIRRAPVNIDGATEQCLDVMVIEVSAAARGRGVFLIWLKNLLWQISMQADYKVQPRLLRFNKVINDRLEDLLLKLGAFIDGEYTCITDFGKARALLTNILSLRETE